ncbi:hypothetical protein [Microcoleus asticus]|uniref:Uncharacterized protein n=1 Tax=Microcoleus asticus IPMA8 TaxID=2563858 RepID=A0ABX2CRQ0_9CYAN|nr:hypothetical protein [Microcoleus asticus]NQE33070.1 hypothetical protein [Microcoleus asticus IPMA8]
MFYKDRVKGIKGVVLVMAGISAIPFGIASLHGFLTASAQATALNEPIGKVLAIAPKNLGNDRPLQIAQVEGCPRAEMVQSFATPNFSIYICKTQEGDIFYRGLSKINGSQINVMQVTTGDDGTYEATNGNIIYSINPQRLQVRQNGKVILTEGVLK